MSNQEKIFNGIKKKTYIYVRYVDDILIHANNTKEIFQNNFVLKFSHELNVNNKSSS